MTKSNLTEQLKYEVISAPISNFEEAVRNAKMKNILCVCQSRDDAMMVAKALNKEFGYV